MGALFYASVPTVPTTPPREEAHAWNFQEFDGLTIPDTNGRDQGRFGTEYPASPVPGRANTPVSEQTYTPGPIRGVAGVLGGQPLPVANPVYRVGRGYTPSRTPTIQFRLGAGQNYQGAAQTVALSEITNNPPVAGDLSAIIAGWA
jgi:hypothetical protein